MAKRRDLSRLRQNIAGMKQCQKAFEGAQKRESVQRKQGGDIPDRENGMCTGEARKQRGGKQISRPQE